MFGRLARWTVGREKRGEHFRIPCVQMRRMVSACGFQTSVPVRFFVTEAGFGIRLEAC
jgi:hypothetical protein